jgi:hypothetical protein
MSFVDEINKFCTIQEDNRIIREVRYADGKKVTEIIPVSAIKEYNKLIKNMDQKRINTIKQIEELK